MTPVFTDTCELQSPHRATTAHSSQSESGLWRKGHNASATNLGGNKRLLLGLFENWAFQQICHQRASTRIVCEHTGDELTAASADTVKELFVVGARVHSLV